MEYLIGLCVVLFGLFIYNKNKRQIAEALLQNVDLKKKLLDIDKDSSKHEALKHLEEEKRKLAKEQLDKDLNAKTTEKELEDFFNS